MIERLKERFKEVFETKQDGIYFAPGRVNLIGEHTDYNGGNVFPCALVIGTYGAAKKRKDSLVRLYSDNFPEVGMIEFGIDDIRYEKKHDWANYPKGLIHVFKEKGLKFDSGFEIFFEGNIPHGAGLSSSASIEVLTAIILNDLFQFDLEMIDMVKLSQKAENQFVGVNSGIMDQFAVGMGKKDMAILLDTNTLEYRYANIQLKDSSIIIANTNKRRGLQDSKYNERRSECEEALRLFKTRFHISALGELTEEEFLANADMIKDEVVRKRAKHAVFENIRTLKAVEALEKKNIGEFGRLMYASHDSLRDDYEVTGIELDTLVELARKQRGVIGSRMTGAGFGGCTVTLIKNEAIDEFIENIGKQYQEIIGYEADFYVVTIGDGAHKLC